MELKTIDELLETVSPSNPVLPVSHFNANAILSGGSPGNHFITAGFTRAISVDSVLRPWAGPERLTDAIKVYGLDPQTGQRVPVLGRAFIDGYTYAGPVIAGRHQLQRWIEPGATAGVHANTAFDSDGDGVPDGIGFPGTESLLTGAEGLIGASTFTFVADTDDDLSTHDTFPAGVQIRVEISHGVLALDGRRLEEPALACTTVGADIISPEPLQTGPVSGRLLMSPSDGSSGSDPLAPITIRLSEPVQPWSLGELPGPDWPALGTALSVSFGPTNSRVDVPFHVRPTSPFDLSSYELLLAFDLPGDGPVSAGCGVLNQVDVSLASGALSDLKGNVSSQAASGSFSTGEGPGVVNAPVTPDTIYVARRGNSPGLSVIDLNGFGGGTGNPAYDPTLQTFEEGNTYFPVNPNVLLQGSSLIPPLAPGTCTVNGGSAGVFTLTKDSSLHDEVVRAPIVRSVGDMALGQALDTTFNNGPSPFGCQSGSGNLCAQDGFKQIVIILGGPTTIIPQPLIPNNSPIQTVTGTANIASWAPSPNPPPLVFPPLCVSPMVGGQEPTSVALSGIASNQLVPGDPFGAPLQGIPPSGLLSSEQNSFWFGPSRSAATPAGCATYMIRQQVGQFLYVIDRARREVVVLNSNRMNVVDRIALRDPTELAMGTNLDFLAVTNQATDSVSFIDVNPDSSTFHEVVVETVVGDAPRGIAWDSANEDILVCNEGGNSMSIISANTLQVRKTVSSQLNQPFAIAMTPRQMGFGFQRFVYFAYVLNRNGKVAVFESGPNTVNGWGYDDVIGIMPYTFQNPQTIQPDHRSLNSSIWVVHQGSLDPVTDQPGPVGTPALTQLGITSSFIGPIALAPPPQVPQFRGMGSEVLVSLGVGVLSGIPLDVAFDNLRNYSGLRNYYTNDFSAGFPQVVNGKSLARTVGNAVRPSNAPTYMFVAVTNPTSGAASEVQVIDLSGYSVVDTNPYQAGVQSIEAPGVTVLMDYFRQ